MYFDNAATSFPKPEPVYEAMDRFLRTAAANPGRSGHGMAVEAERVVLQARTRLARLIGATKPEQVVWTLNCTEALNLALKGVLRPGDRVVTTSLEHNSIARPLHALQQRGVQVIRVPCPGGAFDLPSCRDAITPGTRLVAMLHASNVTGEVLPVAEVAAQCRRVGALLLVDAAQTAGALPLNVQDLGTDLLAMPGHKSLLGPPGTGALYVREGLDLTSLKEGGTGSLSEQEEQPPHMPDRLESGTQNTAGIAGLGAALEWLESTGIEAIHRHEMELVAALWHGLKEIPGVSLHGPPPAPDRASIVSFTLEAWEPTDAATVLDQSFDIQLRPGLHCAPWAHRSLGTFPSGTIRLSPGFFNSCDEADRVVAAVRELVAAR